MINWSSYQKAIFEAYENTKKNIVVEATAGAAKTSTLVECLRRTPPGKKVLFVAFNKSIAEELKLRVPDYIECSTLHSKGLKILMSNFRIKMKLNENKTFSIGLKLLDLSEIKGKEQYRYLFELQSIWNFLRLKNSSDFPIDIPLTCIEKNIEYRDRMNADIEEIHSEWIKRTKKISIGEFEMDFADMLYLPQLLVESVDFPKYDVVMTDECLPYHMPVMCEGGVSYPIGEIVEKKLRLNVLSYNEETGVQEYKPINNWKARPADKKMFKVKGEVNKKSKTYRSYVVCSDNHLIWTENKGYLKPEDISEGDILQFETEAIKTSKYKITLKGKRTLSEQMSKTNEVHNFRPTGRVSKPFLGTRRENGKENRLQRHFSNSLGPDWEEESSMVTTKGQRFLYNASTHYKIDLFNRKLNIGIEIDGASHNRPEKKKEDAEKEKILSELGLKIYRIKREWLSHNFKEIVEKVKNKDFHFPYEHCPIQLSVKAVEEVEIKEDWIYDIGVKDNNNFYANGILVHNCQDLGNLQKNLVLGMVKSRGRFLSVGDKSQSIYQFIGGDTSVFDSFTEQPNTIKLPLSISYRCAKAIVTEANKVFPGKIEAWENAAEGFVRQGEISEAKVNDFILCRNNKPLVEAFIHLMKLKIPAVIKGKDIGENLLVVLEKVREKKDLDMLLEQKISDFQLKGIPEHIAVNTDAYIALEEKVIILKILLNEWETIPKVVSQISSIFSEDIKGKVVLSTIHKSKGLEADTVFFLNENLIPSDKATTETAKYAEQCLRFVAITRAKSSLIYCII